MVSVNTNRAKADAERAAGEASNLPKVRERHFRSADAYDAIAERQERLATSRHVREAELVERAANGGY